MAEDGSGTPAWESIVFQSTFEPPGDAQPDETRAGGSRTTDRCHPEDPPIQVLRPVDRYGLTLEERPEIFVQLQGSSAQDVVLTFQDGVGNHYQRAVIPVPEDAGLVSFRLPPDTSPLMVGKNYQWTVSIMCDRFLSPHDPVFTGWVQRTDRGGPLTEMADAPIQAQAEYLAAEGYWYDLLSLLSQYPIENDAEQTRSNHSVQSFWDYYYLTNVAE